MDVPVSIPQGGASPVKVLAVKICRHFTAIFSNLKMSSRTQFLKGQHRGGWIGCGWSWPWSDLDDLNFHLRRLTESITDNLFHLPRSRGISQNHPPSQDESPSSTPGEASS